MSRPVAILRPDPGNAASCLVARSFGLTVHSLPLFAVGPLDWTPPDPTRHDALVLTSANALRWGGGRPQPSAVASGVCRWPRHRSSGDRTWLHRRHNWRQQR